MKSLIALVPAIVVLIAAASCGFSAQVHDAEYGEFGNIATGITTLAALALAVVVGVGGVVVHRVSRGNDRTVAAALLLAAVMMPIGVGAGVRLGESGIIQPAPTLPPELQPTPVPTVAPPGGGVPDAEPTGTMTLDLNSPNELHVSGAASCEHGHSVIRESDLNADWDIEWAGRIVIIRLELNIVARPPGPTSVGSMAITLSEKYGDGVTYASQGLLPEDASSVVDGAQSGEVNFHLRPMGQPASSPASIAQWPADLTGQISWSCDF